MMESVRVNDDGAPEPVELAEPSWFHKQYKELTADERLLAQMHINAYIKYVVTTRQQLLFRDEPDTYLPEGCDMGVWMAYIGVVGKLTNEVYSEWMIERNETTDPNFPMTTVEKAALDFWQNEIKILSTPPTTFQRIVLGYPQLHSYAEAIDVKENCNINQFKHPEYPGHRFNPTGYHPGGKMPRYRLQSSMHYHLKDVRTNRLAGTPKSLFPLFKWPGWRIGAFATVAFIIWDESVGGIKAGMAHHHDHHYNPREHMWFGPQGNDSDNRML